MNFLNGLTTTTVSSFHGFLDSLEEKVFCFFCVFLIFATSVAGETKELETLLPSGESQGSWELADEPMKYGAANLYDFINGGAEVYLEYGFVQVISQEYAKGEDAIICTIYEMKTPAAAFGIFSYNRTPQKQSTALGDGGFKGGFQTVFWQDRFYVIIESYTPGEEMERAVSSFAKQISDKVGAHAEEPVAVRKLPVENLIDGSTKLLGGQLGLGSLLFLGKPGLFALGDDDTILYGEYGSLEDKSKLFLVIYGAPDEADRAASRIGEVFTSDEDFRSLSQPATWNRDGRYVALGHRGNALALVTDASSEEKAQGILDGCLKIQ